MPKDNYTVRKQYEGLKEVDGQLIPQRGDVKPEDLVTGQPESEEAVKNGGGDETKTRRRRRTTEEE